MLPSQRSLHTQLPRNLPMVHLITPTWLSGMIKFVGGKRTLQAPQKGLNYEFYHSWLHKIFDGGEVLSLSLNQAKWSGEALADLQSHPLPPYYWSSCQQHPAPFIAGANISLGDTVEPYMGPAPPAGSGPHRYILRIFNQTSNLTVRSSQLGLYDDNFELEFRGFNSDYAAAITSLTAYKGRSITGFE